MKNKIFHTQDLCLRTNLRCAKDSARMEIIMNPASIMKLMSAKNKFQKNHPKFVAFLNRCFAGGLKEGTIIEITVTNPGEAPITSNIKVQQSDLELLEELKEMGR